MTLGQPLPGPNQPGPVAGTLVRMNPMIQPVRVQEGSWRLPEGLTLLDFDALANLEMDAVEQAEVEQIVNLGRQ